MLVKIRSLQQKLDANPKFHIHFEYTVDMPKTRQLPVQVVTSVERAGNLVTSCGNVAKTSPWRQPARGDTW
jgi:hypothetical protein